MVFENGKKNIQAAAYNGVRTAVVSVVHYFGMTYERKKFACQPQKCKLELCMSNGSKVLIYLSFLSFLFFLKEAFFGYCCCCYCSKSKQTYGYYVVCMLYAAVLYPD